MQRDRARNRGRRAALPTVHSVKLKSAVLVGKRGGPCTPIPAWKMSLGEQPYRLKDRPEKLPTISARKLAANLWELQGVSKASSSAMKKTSRSSHHQAKDRDAGRERSPLQLPAHLSDPSHSPRPQIAVSGNSIRREMAGSLMQHRGSVERNGGALQTVSPASCSSSLEAVQDLARVGVLPDSHEAQTMKVAVCRPLLRLDVDLEHTLADLGNNVPLQVRTQGQKYRNALQQ